MKASLPLLTTVLVRLRAHLVQKGVTNDLTLLSLLCLNEMVTFREERLIVELY